MRIGAHYLGNGTCEFVVWAPFLKSVAVKLISPDERLLPMKKDEKGYWKACVEDVYPGACYFYQLGEKTDRPTRLHISSLPECINIHRWWNSTPSNGKIVNGKG